jgi:hypothetical protein
MEPAPLKKSRPETVEHAIQAIMEGLHQEATAAAVKLGFTPGRKLREEVEAEISWWETVQSVCLIDVDDESQKQLRTDPQGARLCALEGISTMLDPWECTDVGPIARTQPSDTLSRAQRLTPCRISSATLASWQRCGRRIV